MLPFELLARSADQPWLPTPVPGKSLKLLCCLEGDGGFVELLRMEPGVELPLHRHTAETHVFMLSGQRQLGTGEIIGTGDYVYEPPGNTDSWIVVGDEPMIAFLVVMGDVEFLAADGSVANVVNAASMRKNYQTA